YSFGVMIYEVLTDSFPPIEIDIADEGASAGSNYHLDLEQVRHLLRDCPQDLTDLCIDLLRAVPSTRPLGSEIVQRLSGARQRPRQVKQPLLCLGREAELAVLNEATQMLTGAASRQTIEDSQPSVRRAAGRQYAARQRPGLVILHGE